MLLDATYTPLECFEEDPRKGEFVLKEELIQALCVPIQTGA